MSTLQTLDRGIQALIAVAARPDGMSVADLCRELDIPRANGYRIVATLAAHGFLHRGDDGWVRLGAALPALASRYWPGFLARVQPRLQELADAAGATGFVTVAEADECVVLVTTEPAAPILRVGYRSGSRHSLRRGAAGIAILAARPPRDDDPPEVRQARADGFAITRGQLEPGAVGVATAIPRTGTAAALPEASLGIVALEGYDARGAAALVVAAAADVARLTGENR
jgi:DNA-binding IclR family transcriptional regulator